MLPRAQRVLSPSHGRDKISQMRLTALSVSFLDSSACLRVGQHPLVPSFNIPSTIMEYLGDKIEIQDMATHFFETVHTWMPFISRKRLLNYLVYDMGVNVHSPSPSTTMLLHCMKLMLWKPGAVSFPGSDEGSKEPNPLTPAYIDAKALWLEAEMAGILSLTILQAGLLLACYEIAHAIYPAACLSVASCAKYGMALGIDRPDKELQVDDWVEAEEKKRVWWTVVILDRLVMLELALSPSEDSSCPLAFVQITLSETRSFSSLGNPERSLVTEDPTLDTALPMDDTAWDVGVSRGIPVFLLFVVQSLTF